MTEQAGEYTVKCDNPNCDGGGYVTKEYVERRHAESHLQKMNAYYNLASAMGLRSKKTAEQLIKELGF